MFVASCSSTNDSSSNRLSQSNIRIAAVSNNNTTTITKLVQKVKNKEQVACNRRDVNGEGGKYQHWSCCMLYRYIDI